MNAFTRLRQQAQAESVRTYQARGILIPRCELCQLKTTLCICQDAPQPTSDVDFLLIMQRIELFKPTNTGRLIADVFPENTFAFCWSRLEPPKELLDFLQDPCREFVIVFPASDEKRKVLSTPPPVSKGKKLTYIILDGTWRQGRRMFNHSRWLDAFPALTLRPEQKALYATRKAAHADYLSTAESAVLALHLAGKTESAQALMNYFELFHSRYLIMKNS